MSRTSFVAGLMMAIAVHAAILWAARQPTMADQSPPCEPAPIIVDVPPVAQESPQVVNDHKAAAGQQDGPHLDDVVRPVSAVDPASGVGEMASDGTAPPLRVTWDSPAQLTTVARSLGMKVVAVNASHEIVGEVSLAGRAVLREFSGELSGFSNRVRTLHLDFFGRGLTSGTSAKSLWVLVPSHHDARFIELQRGAIRQEGISPDAVRIVDARIDRRGNLTITRIHKKER